MADRVTVIGWDGSPLPGAARSALAAATLVAGAAHHLALPDVPAAAERLRMGSTALAARRITRHRGSAVVLADGDPGFFGLLRTLRSAEYGLEVEVVPAVSSVAAAFAKAGMPWDDAKVVTANGRTLRRAVNVCRAHPKVAVLTSPGAGPAELALMLGEVPRTFVVCEGLGGEHEDVHVLTSEKVADRTWRDPNVVLVIGGRLSADAAPGTGWLAGVPEEPVEVARGWALPAATYAPASDTSPPPEPSAADSPQLRALQLARLGPRVGDLVWDVGAGGGAFSVEAARFGAAVIAVERDSRSCARTAEAAARFGVQVQTVAGAAPQVLEALPEPDVVRVGGGGPRTVRAVADRRPGRIVTHARTRDEAEEIGRALADGGYAVECALLQSVALDAGDWTERERAVVFVLSGVRG